MNSNKKINKKFSNILKNIFINIDKSKNAFHSLSKKFELNCKLKDLDKFKNLIVLLS